MRLRIATWNVWWRFGDWPRREAAVLDELARVDADVVCLQETWLLTGDRLGDPRGVLDGPGHDVEASQAARIAHHLGLEEWRCGWRHAHEGAAFGNAILSRHPITADGVLPLPDGGEWTEHRSATFAVVATPAGEIPVVTAHLNFRPEHSHVRIEQLRSVATWLAAHRRELPSVLTGDLNAEPMSDELRMLTGLAPVAVRDLVLFDAWRVTGNDEAPTWSRTNTHAARGTVEPDRRIDHVLVAPPPHDGRGRVVAADRFGLERVDGEHPSDHYGVWVDLDLTPRSLQHSAAAP